MTQLRGRRRVWLLAVLLTGQFMANVDTAIVNVAAPAIRAGLRTTGGEIQLVISGYTLAYAMLLITGARLGDIRGYRRIFLLGLGGFTLTSLTCGLAPDAIVLTLARIVQGACTALMVPQVLSSIQTHFSGAGKARALGLYAAALSGGAVAGQVLGGVLVSANLFGSGWRSIFLINVPIGVVLMAFAIRCLPADREGRPQRLDLRGVAMLATAVLLAVLPLMLGRDRGWPLWAWISLAVSIPTLAAFVAWERRIAAEGGYPLVNLHVLTRPAVSWGLTAYGAATATYFSMLFILALYLQQGLGKSPLYSGLALVSWVAAFGIAGALARRLPGRLATLAPTIGYLILAASHLGICADLLTGHQGGVLLITLLGAGGFGLGTGFSPLIAHLISDVPSRYAPDMSGIITTTAQLAGVVGVATFGTVYIGLVPHPSPHPAMHAFAIITAGLATAAVLAAAAAYRSVRYPADATHESARADAA